MQPSGYDHAMIQFRFISALFLLVISLVLTSGAGATVASLIQEGNAPACCDADAGKASLPLDTPCSEPDCQCISCLSFVVPPCSYRLAYDYSFAAASFNSLVEALPLEFFKSIDYPPEFS